MNNKDMPAMPFGYKEFAGPVEVDKDEYSGLTKREHFAAVAMQGILSQGEANGELVVSPNGETLYAEDCVKILNQTQKELNDLKQSIPKIKADTVRDALEICRDVYIYYADLEDYANQLEGKDNE